MKQADYDLNVRLNPEAAEIELEWILASLMYPNFSISYDENGHYWKMNDRRINGPNFMGFVPKWLRDDAAAFQLMVHEGLYPFERHSRDGISMCALRTNEDIDIYAEVEEQTFDAKRAATRIAIVKAAIAKFKEKPRDCALDSL